MVFVNSCTTVQPDTSGTGGSPLKAVELSAACTPTEHNGMPNRPAPVINDKLPICIALDTIAKSETNLALRPTKSARWLGN